MLTEYLLYLRLILLRGNVSRQLAFDAVDVTLWNQARGEERLLGHAVIALSIDRRNVTLVAEKNLHALPINVSALALGEQFVQALRSRAAGESNGTRRFLLQARIEDRAHPECGGEEKIACGGEHFEGSAGLCLA